MNRLATAVRSASVGPLRFWLRFRVESLSFILPISLCLGCQGAKASSGHDWILLHCHRARQELWSLWQETMASIEEL